MAQPTDELHRAYTTERYDGDAKPWHAKKRKSVKDDAYTTHEDEDYFKAQSQKRALREM